MVVIKDLLAVGRLNQYIATPPPKHLSKYRADLGKLLKNKFLSLDWTAQSKMCTSHNWSFLFFFFHGFPYLVKLLGV